MHAHYFLGMSRGEITKSRGLGSSCCEEKRGFMNNRRRSIGRGSDMVRKLAVAQWRADARERFRVGAYSEALRLKWYRHRGIG